MSDPSLPTNSVLSSGIRTFKPRRSRITPSQRNGLIYGGENLLTFTNRTLRSTYLWPELKSPLFIDIGFGNGVSSIALAEANPEYSFLAIDVHTPGVGNLLGEIHTRGLKNIRVMETDSIAVLEHMIAPDSISGIYTLFPDPWPKSRHHKRRIVQPAIMNLFNSRLVPQGFWHIATDWQDYADCITGLFEQPNYEPRWSGGIVNRPDRPITHYERRAIQDGRTVTDFRFVRCE
jgi:tRNA (guanine-N7-)-methyltransferase